MRNSSDSRTTTWNRETWQNDKWWGIRKHILYIMLSRQQNNQPTARTVGIYPRYSHSGHASHGTERPTNPHPMRENERGTEYEGHPFYLKIVKVHALATWTKSPNWWKGLVQSTYTLQHPLSRVTGEEKVNTWTQTGEEKINMWTQTREEKVNTWTQRRATAILQ
jgi:hypothetical protein